MPGYLDYAVLLLTKGTKVTKHVCMAKNSSYKAIIIFLCAALLEATPTNKLDITPITPEQADTLICNAVKRARKTKLPKEYLEKIADQAYGLVEAQVSNEKTFIKFLSRIVSEVSKEWFKSKNKTTKKRNNIPKHEYTPKQEKKMRCREARTPTPEPAPVDDINEPPNWIRPLQEQVYLLQCKSIPGATSAQLAVMHAQAIQNLMEQQKELTPGAIAQEAFEQGQRLLQGTLFLNSQLPLFFLGNRGAASLRKDAYPAPISLYEHCMGVEKGPLDLPLFCDNFIEKASVSDSWATAHFICKIEHRWALISAIKTPDTSINLLVLDPLGAYSPITGEIPHEAIAPILEYVQHIQEHLNPVFY